ncbi:MAG: redoxin domain-containing protein, partial [Oscillospiraceae bacterium]
MKKRTVILLSILLVALIFAATIGYNALMKNYKADTLVGQGTDPTAQSGENSTPEKTPAADFTVYDQEGNEVKLSDYFGKPIVLNFWTSWCGPCKQEMPHFEKTFVERGKDIHFLMV